MYISIRLRRGLLRYSSGSYDSSWSTRRSGRLGRERSSQPRNIKILYKTRLLSIR
jgi:hypothetical protein